MTVPDPNRDYAKTLVLKLREAGFEALWAGGCVRDFLLGRTPKDYDIATNATPDQVRDLFGRKRTLAVGASFGVIVVLAPKGVEQVEVATFRSEGGYHDGRRPTQVVFTSAEEDAKRRDFTINGMFYDPIEEAVRDYVGGEADLNAGVIRAIGDPHARMTEDKLRTLRAIRFAATLEFQLESTTQNAVCEMATQLTVVSAERIAQELRRMLVDPHRRRAVELLAETNLLTVIFPEFGPLMHEEPHRWDETLRTLDELDRPSFALAAAALWHGLPDGGSRGKVAHRLGKRLRLSNDDIQQITWLLEHHRSLDNADQLPAHQLKRILAATGIDDLLALIQAERTAREVELSPVEFCQNYLATHSAAEINPPPLVGGHDLIQMGLRPGKEFKSLLDAIRDAQLDGIVQNTDEALAMVKQLRES
ncbi:CCA tRNA nucleotidyltransferase [Thalassoroseus pseudoceratinae]|uniref:CCA tRNA nucleotidyltransferase n=1 Tax=Thalassoroseus pseudoceratinae TaxID=2713176 RepID=UPI001421ED81|nr:CCA tRNA nucleotidyltransferase [Thalassoroseus pseudoceratinae]